MREYTLLLLPLVFSALLFGFLSLKSKSNYASSTIFSNLVSTSSSGTRGDGDLPVNPNEPSIDGPDGPDVIGPDGPISPDEPSDVDSSTCSCPEMAACVVSGNPVLGGVDFVQYFTNFKQSDGTYNESEIGSIGSSDYSSTYNGNLFYFQSQSNKETFDSSPSYYIPQYGGFCAWGIGGEYCPPYPWSQDCLGPSGNWGHWTIVEEKLYFFFFAEAKEKFMANATYYAEAGSSRWDSWFATDTYFSTDCYVSTVSD